MDEKEACDLVISITGAKFTRVEVIEALRMCEGDPDDAIEHLNSISKKQMFSSTTVKKTDEVKKEGLKLDKPDHLRKVEE